MKNNKISLIQLQSLIFLEMLGMEAMLLPKIGENIYTILIMSIFTLFLSIVSGLLFKNFSYINLNGVIGKIIQLLFSIKISVILGLVLYIFSFFVKQTILENAKIYVISIILILGALYCGFLGIETIGRTAEILLPFISVPLILACCFGAKNTDLANYNTEFDNIYVWRGLMLSLNVTSVETIILGKDYLNKVNFQIGAIRSIVFGMLFIIGVSTVAYGVYGNIDFNLQSFPTLELIYTSGVFVFLQRQEEIFICLWIFAAILYLSSHLFFARILFGKAMNIKNGISSFVIALFIYVISFIPNTLEQALNQFCYINVYGSIFFILAIPFFVGRYLK